jgi:hypothetical protein
MINLFITYSSSMEDSPENSYDTNSLERHMVPNVHNLVQHLSLDPLLGKQCEATFSRPLPTNIFEIELRPDCSNEEGLK